MIRPCIVFVDRAEEAINFYVSIIPNSRVLSMARSESEGPVPKGQVLSAIFELDGREYLTFDGGPSFAFTEGFSLMITCKSQQEIDHYWSQLIAGGGEEGPCGWLKDRFGMSWQVIPESLGRMLSDSEHGDNVAATQAMLKMKKLDLAELERAYRGSRVA